MKPEEPALFTDSGDNSNLAEVFDVLNSARVSDGQAKRTDVDIAEVLFQKFEIQVPEKIGEINCSQPRDPDVQQNIK